MQIGRAERTRRTMSVKQILQVQWAFAVNRAKDQAQSVEIDPCLERRPVQGLTSSCHRFPWFKSTGQLNGPVLLGL